MPTPKKRPRLSQTAHYLTSSQRRREDDAENEPLLRRRAVVEITRMNETVLNMYLWRPILAVRRLPIVNENQLTNRIDLTTPSGNEEPVNHAHDLSPDVHVQEVAQPERVDAEPAILRTPSMVDLPQAGNEQVPYVRAPPQDNIQPDAAEVQPSPLLPPPPAQPPRPVVAPPAPPRRWHPPVPHRRTYRHGMFDGENVELLERYDLGNFAPRCRHCDAKFFEREQPNRQGNYYVCCKSGSVQLEPLRDCPEELHRLLTSDDHLSIQYRTNVRSANSSFAMASFNTNIPNDRNVGQGAWCFHICGQVYHFLEPVPDERAENAKFNQLYFVDAAEALDRRAAVIGERIDLRTLSVLEDMLRRDNVLVRSYCTMREVLNQTRERRLNVDNIFLAFKENINNDLRRYNIPESRTDIAAIFTGEEPPFQVDLIVYPRGVAGQRNKIKNLSRLADPMVYPLLFPYGENGYEMQRQHVGNAAARGVAVTFRQYYSYRLQSRDRFSIMHNSGKLFQQYVVDAWTKIESNNMWYIKQNQVKLRTENYNGLMRYLADRARDQNVRVGKVTVLPAAHVGSPRYMNRRYLDAMAVVARHGKPDLFITFTCNPRWLEITQNLEFHQRYEHRPDLVCRVFRAKLVEFLDDLNKKQLWGVVQSYMYVIEFQKRGLPHAHILVTMRPEDRIADAESVDQIVSAYIPDRDAGPILYDVVTEHYIHKPCGADNPAAVCMKDGQCSKRYPKPFSDQTRLNVNNHTIYRRPWDGRVANVGQTPVDNRRIVPYNRYAAVKYRSHINFESCASIGVVKYLYKYVYKGQDCITVHAQPEGDVLNWNEVDRYLDCRYVSSMEAAWRIFEFPLCDRSHAVVTLTVHLPDEHLVYFDENADDQAIQAAAQRPTMLTAWFELNRADPDARELKYAEVPDHYTWNAQNRTWNQRHQVSKTIGSLMDVSPADVELFHLRMVLLNRAGATSFRDLRTVEGHECESFVEVCERMHLLDRVDEYERCLREAALFREPYKYRRLFALLCCTVAEQLQHQLRYLWRSYKRHMCEDYIRRGSTVAEANRLAYECVKEIVDRNGGPDLDALRFFDDLQHDGDDDSDDDSGHRPDRSQQPGTAAPRQPATNQNQNNRDNHHGDPNTLNADQRVIYDAVMNAILGNNNNNINVFYVDGPGGTGKTYFYNVLIGSLRSSGRDTIAVAWTGIAATLLIGGKTVHRVLKLPLTLNENTVSGFNVNSPQSIFIRNAAVIVWDEAPMTPKLALHAVDRYLRDLMNRPDVIMGGKVVVLGGDFRQVLPVIPRAHRTAVIQASIRMSPMWAQMRHYQLSTNVRTAADEVEFARLLMNLGNGQCQKHKMNTGADDIIEIPRDMLEPSVDDLLRSVYGEELQNDVATNIAILCPTNAAVDEINTMVLQRVPGDERVYLSVDEYPNSEEDEFHVPLELLNSIKCASLPPHRLVVKVGTIVMLLRNLDVQMGLCNGTRLQIVSMRDHVMEVEVLTGSNRGDRTYLPRIKVRANDVSLPKPMTRTQFPIRLAYAMIINKSQGQTFGKVGVCLKQPCFAHGQLYVALSRLRRRQDVRVYIENSVQQGHFHHKTGRMFTRNVVYESVISRSDVRVVLNNPPLPPPPIPAPVTARHGTANVPQNNYRGDLLPVDLAAAFEDDNFTPDDYRPAATSTRNNPVLPDEDLALIFDEDNEQVMEWIQDEVQMPPMLMPPPWLPPRVSVLDQPGTSGIR